MRLVVLAPLGGVVMRKKTCDLREQKIQRTYLRIMERVRGMEVLGKVIRITDHRQVAIGACELAYAKLHSLLDPPEPPSVYKEVEIEEMSGDEARALLRHVEAAANAFRDAWFEGEDETGEP